MVTIPCVQNHESCAYVPFAKRRRCVIDSSGAPPSLLLGEAYWARLLLRYAGGFHENRMDVFGQFDSSGF